MCSLYQQQAVSCSSSPFLHRNKRCVEQKCFRKLLISAGRFSSTVYQDRKGSHGSPCTEKLPAITTPQLICVLIAPDFLLSPDSLAKNWSIFIFPNDQFVWQHFSGLAVEKLQLLIWITKRGNCFMWLDLLHSCW